MVAEVVGVVVDDVVGEVVAVVVGDEVAVDVIVLVAVVVGLDVCVEVPVLVCVVVGVVVVVDVGVLVAVEVSDVVPVLVSVVVPVEVPLVVPVVVELVVGDVVIVLVAVVVGELVAVVVAEVVGDEVAVVVELVVGVLVAEVVGVLVADVVGVLVGVDVIVVVCDDVAVVVCVVVGVVRRQPANVPSRNELIASFSRSVVLAQFVDTKRPVGVHPIVVHVCCSIGARYVSSPRLSVSAMALHSANVVAANVSGIPEDDTQVTVVVVPDEHDDARFVRWVAWSGQFSARMAWRYVNGADSKHVILACTGVVVCEVVMVVVADVVAEVVADVVCDVVAVVVAVVVGVVTSQFTSVPACSSARTSCRVATLEAHPPVVMMNPSRSQVKLAVSPCMVYSLTATLSARATVSHAVRFWTCMNMLVARPLQLIESTGTAALHSPTRRSSCVA